MRIAALLLALFVLIGCSSPAGRTSGGQAAVEAPDASEGAQSPAASADADSAAGPADAEPPGASGAADAPASSGDTGAPAPPGEADATAPEERDWDDRARKADERLAELRRELDFPVFIPTQLPEGLHPLTPTYDRLVSISYVDDDLNRVLSVASGPAGCCLDADPRKMVGGGTPIRKGSEARFIPVEPEFGGNILWWNEDGAYIALSGPHLTQEDLFAIAESLSPTATLTGPADALPPDVYPPDFRTGVPEVDAVIDAFLAQDADRLTSCDMVRCEADAEGVLEPVVTWGSCQVNNTWTGWDTVRSLLEGWVREPRLLYAAYRVHEIGDWAYFVQFAEYRLDPGAKGAVLDADGRILQLWMGCGAPLDMTGDHYEPLAPPRVN